MTITLTTPVTVGDFDTSFTISQLTLLSVSFSFGAGGVLTSISVVLQDPASGYQRVVTLAGAQLGTLGASFATDFPNFGDTILQLLQNAGKLPAGVIS